MFLHRVSCFWLPDQAGHPTSQRQGLTAKLSRGSGGRSLPPGPAFLGLLPPHPVPPQMGGASVCLAGRGGARGHPHFRHLGRGFHARRASGLCDVRGGGGSGRGCVGHAQYTNLAYRVARRRDFLCGGGAPAARRKLGKGAPEHVNLHEPAIGSRRRAYVCERDLCLV